MTRTDTDPHADEQDPTRCICWDDPTTNQTATASTARTSWTSTSAAITNAK